ncbi:MAG: RsmF rRNA methyltransferase first C-terminal domain-containing protein [Gallintestinimicrobium sp.]
MNLPSAFLTRMQEMLGEEYEAFLQSYESGHYQSLRLNPRKTDREEFTEKSPFHLTPVAWEKTVFITAKRYTGQAPVSRGWCLLYSGSERDGACRISGRTAGGLCAGSVRCPGGKSTQIGAAMQGKGILVCNEIHPARAKILSENVERMGLTNAVVTNESPERLSAYFPEYFDKILVDAPCSGEGMFRKHEEACSEWSPENVELCAKRQDSVLDEAAAMLKKGGRLVYSTCTFALQEDEGSVARFLLRHPEFSIKETHRYDGMEPGRPDWAGTEPVPDGMEKTIRLWPHKLHGEGHFLAVLEKTGEVPEGYRARSLYGIQKGIAPKDFAAWKEFERESLKKQFDGIFLLFGDQLYLAPKDMPALKGLKVLRPGLHLGTMKKGRFEPTHALALSLSPKDAVHCCNLSGDSQEARQWINGMTLSKDGEKGWQLVCVDGYSLGWGKLAGGILKNHYPKGLRKTM